MKCFNCGFESNDTYCAMCGTKLKDNEPQMGVISNENRPTAYYTNAETNPYQQTHHIPPTPPQSMPTPQQYSPYPVQEVQTKKSGNTLPIVLSIIVCAVIVIGIVINIISSTIYNNSVLDMLSDLTGDDYYSDVYYDDLSDATTDEDSVKHPMNEASEFKYGKITLTNVEVTNNKLEFSNDAHVCAFTFEVENTTDKAVKFSVPSVQVGDSTTDFYADSYLDDLDTYVWLYDDYEGASSDYEFNIDAGETKTFVSYYKIPNTITNFSLLVDLYDSEFTYDFICYFETSLPQAETTVPATQKDN